MRYEELSKKVIEWANEKGILQKSNPLRQLDKTQEELDETRRALKMLDNLLQERKQNLFDDLAEQEREEAYWHHEVKDGIGDMLVTIIILAKLSGLDGLDCLQTAYNVIKNRTGKMINGHFVKDV
jgi:NTP pyrophosphatase (non-canonical NTP hydrolase)